MRARLDRARALATLGPDLLGTDFDAAGALARLRQRGTLTIGDALLDQRAVAGIGNVYKSETCFLCGVSPFARWRRSTTMRSASCSRPRARCSGPTSWTGAPERSSRYRGLRRTTHRSDPEERLWVYGRAGRPCRKCGTPIRMVKQGEGARVTYFCERCQGVVRVAKSLPSSIVRRPDDADVGRAEPEPMSLAP